MDPRDQSVVIRIVYDGPPEAGKTTSLRALARGFGREVYTPEEQDGRTVYFDWLEYTGGRFDGAPIRCEIVSVPGQERWLQRRLYMLERADAVVFVGDTSAAGWGPTLERLADLRRRLDARRGPPVGVVFQANRRDTPGAVPIASVRAGIASPRTAVVEAVAIEGTGVREAFVFAVRLALDHVRELEPERAFVRRVAGGSGERLLGSLQALELVSTPRVEPSVEATRRAEPMCAVAAVSERATLPRTPSHEVPSGLVWPPVEGRIVLREATAGGVVASPTSAGDFTAEQRDGWLLHSAAGAAFDDVERGRSALIAWARLHASAQGVLSPRRCIVLAESGDGGFRLWQIVRRDPSLRDLFGDGSEPMDPQTAARRLASANRRLAEARALCVAASLRLPCTLDTIGISEGDRAAFVGLVPSTAELELSPALLAV